VSFSPREAWGEGGPELVEGPDEGQPRRRSVMKPEALRLPV